METPRRPLHEANEMSARAHPDQALEQPMLISREAPLHRTIPGATVDAANAVAHRIE